LFQGDKKETLYSTHPQAARTPRLMALKAALVSRSSSSPTLERMKEEEEGREEIRESRTRTTNE
jgi:hypothetical protein